VLTFRFSVHEVLAQLEADKEFWDGKVYITPPDNGSVTDEDSADEEGGTVNNLSGKQLECPAVATVRIGSELVSLGEAPTNQSDCDAEGEYAGAISRQASHKSSVNAKRKRQPVQNKPRKKVVLDNQITDGAHAKDVNSGVAVMERSKELQKK